MPDPSPPQETVDLVVADPGGVPYDDDVDDDPTGQTFAPGVTRFDGLGAVQAAMPDYPKAPMPGLVALRTYVLARYGGFDRGILAVPPRTIRDGSLPSIHNWGMAWDWQWGGDNGPGRTTCDAVIDFWLSNAAVLDVQAVHDYQRGRIWRSNRDAWKDQPANPKNGMHQSWAQWLHVERNLDGARSSRPIEALLGGAPADPGVAKDAAALPDGPLSQQLQSQGADVARMQDFLRFFGFAGFTRSDGVFGPRTEQAVIAAQTAFQAAGTYTARVDGEWGPKTAAAATLVVRPG
jgi:hypothetical protein